MNDPERMLDAGSPLERELLESASTDAGSDLAYRRVQQAIGAAAALGTASSSTATTGAALGAGKAKAGASMLFGKWLIMGATAGTVVAGTAYVALGSGPPAAAPRAVSHPSPPSLMATPPGAPLPGTSAAGLARVEPSMGPPSGVMPSRTPAAVLREHRERAPASGAPPLDSREAAPAMAVAATGSEPRARSLADEVHLVDTARAALARNDFKAALAALGQHRAEFPAGALRLEVEVLVVRALLRGGRGAEAEREGSRVLSAHPTGPYAERIRGLLAGREKP